MIEAWSYKQVVYDSMENQLIQFGQVKFFMTRPIWA